MSGRSKQVSDLIRGWRGICAEVGKCRQQLWRDIKAGKFPAPIELGPNSLAWHRSEIDAWRASLPRRQYGGGAGHLRLVSSGHDDKA